MLKGYTVAIAAALVLAVLSFKIAAATEFESTYDVQQSRTW